MPSDFLFPKLDAPRLKARPSKANPERLYWVARTDIVKTGYRPETVRIHHDIRDPDAHRLIEAMCKRLQAEMLAWKAGIGRERKLCDGTVGGLVRAYQVDRASPYHELKWNTRRTYDELLDKVVNAIGGGNPCRVRHVGPPPLA